MRARPLRLAATVAALLGAAGCGSATGPSAERMSALRRGEQVLTLEIGPQRVPCVGVEPQLCTLVRGRPDGEWQLFYDWIEDLDYEPGFRYVVMVAVRVVPDPPADGSSIAYRLVRLLEKTPAP